MVTLLHSNDERIIARLDDGKIVNMTDIAIDIKLRNGAGKRERKHIEFEDMLVLNKVIWLYQTARNKRTIDALDIIAPVVLSRIGASSLDLDKVMKEGF